MRNRIAVVKGVCLKGQTFTETLEPATVFTGDNGAGKTARLDAIMLALAGQHPKHGKQNASVFRLSSGSIMAAHVTLTDGQFVERRWTEKKGSVSMERNGCELNMSPVALDAAEYFAMSERDRLALVFRSSEGEARDYGAELAAKVKGIKLEEQTAEAEKLCQTIAGEIMENWNARGEQTGAQWLDGFAATAKVKQSDATAAAKRMVGTLAGVTELRAQATAPSAGAEAAAEAARTAHGQVTGERDRLTGRLAADEKTATRRRELDASIAASRQAMNALAGERARLAELEADLQAQRDSAPEAEAKAKTAENDLSEGKRRQAALAAEKNRAEFDEAGRAECNDTLDAAGENEQVLAESVRIIGELEPVVSNFKSTTADCQQAVDKSSMAVGLLRADTERCERAVSEIEAESERLTHLETCPFCHANNSGWKLLAGQDVHKRLTAAKATLAQLRSDLERAEQADAEAKLKLDCAKAADAQHQKDVTALSDARQNRQIAEQERDAAATRLKSFTSRPVAEVESDIAAQERELVRLQSAKNEAADAAEAARKADAALFSKREELRALRAKLAAVPDYAADIARAEGELAGLPAAVDRAAIEKALASMEAAVAESKVRLDAAVQKARELVASRAQAATKLQAEEKALGLQCEQAIWKRTREFVDELQADAVTDAFKPMLAVANRIAGPVLKGTLEYRNGELGRMSGRNWISHSTFSGSEQAVTFAALTVALASLTRSPLRVAIVDEMDRLTSANKKALMECVCAAIRDDVLDQFCGCDVRESDYIGMRDVHVIPVGKDFTS